MATANLGERPRARRGRRLDSHRGRPPAGTSRTAGYVFVALYVGLLLLLGIAPVGYAIYLALSPPASGGGPGFIDTITDYRFLPAFEHVVEFMAFWLVSQTVLVVALVLDAAHALTPGRRALPVPLLHPRRAGGRGERGCLALPARSEREPVRVHPALARLRTVQQHDRTAEPPRHLRADGLLDRRRRLDRRDVRRAQQHPERAARGRRDGRGERPRHGAADQAATDSQVDRVHARPVVRRRHAALRRTIRPGHGVAGSRGQQVLVTEPARLVRRVPVRAATTRRPRSRSTSSSSDSSSPRCSSGADASSSSTDGVPQRYPLRVILAILLAFAAFFFVPMVWLFLAPTKTDGQLLTRSPFAFGSLHTFAHTFHRVVTYDSDSLLIWLKNSAIYSFGGTALAVVCRDPGRVRTRAHAVHRAPRAARRSRSS